MNIFCHFFGYPMYKAVFIFFLMFWAIAGFAEAKRYGVQAGAFKEMAYARERLEILKTKGYESRIIPTGTPSGTIRFKVVVGSHASKPEARGSESRLRRILPYDFFITELPEKYLPQQPVIRVAPLTEVHSIRQILPPVPSDPLPLRGGEELLQDLGPRERGLAMARIAARKENLAKALDLYQDLSGQYPDDTEVMSDLAETLINAGEFTAAAAILLPWQEREPDNPEPLRELGRLYIESDKPKEAARLFDRITEMTPDDTRAFADAGYARLESGDWEGALEFFSKVLDHDPENESAAQIVRELLEEHRPRLETGLSYTQQTSGASLTQIFSRGTIHAGPWTRLELTATNLVTEKTTYEDVRRTSTNLLLTHTPDSNITLHTGLGHTEDLGISPGLGLTWKPGKQSALSSEVTVNAPWVSSFEAPGLDGTFWKIQGGYDHSLRQRLTLDTSFWHTGYMLDRTSPYADEYGIEASLIQKLHGLPELSAFYTFRRTWLAYARQGEHAIALNDESAHTLGLRYTGWLSPDLGFGVGGGAGVSEFKDGLLLNFTPWLIIRLGPRLRWETRYMYTNQSASGNTEQSHSVDSSVRVVF